MMMMMVADDKECSLYYYVMPYIIRYVTSYRYLQHYATCPLFKTQDIRWRALRAK